MIKYITTDEEVVQVIEDILTFEGEFIPLDTETTSLDTQTAKLLLFQFKLDDDIYVINSVTVSLVDRIVDAIIQNGATCIAHNAKYDAKIIMSNLGREIKHWQDTMYLEVAIHAGVGKMYYSLNELVELYLGRKLDKEVRLGFIEKIDGDFTQEEIDYSANDVDVLLPIYLRQMEILEEAGMTEIATIEGRLSPVIASMEQNGITLNVDAWLSILEKAKIDMKQKYELVMNTLMGYIDFTKFKNAYQAYEFLAIRVTTKKKRSLLEEIQNLVEIRDYVVNDFNMNSNNQLKSLLSYIYDEDLSSVGKKALNDLASRTKEDTEPLNQLLDYRQASKKVSTYGTKFLGHIHPVTGRVHSSYSNIGTATGRMASSRPNLQNIPRGEEYRHAFTARDGFKIIGIDYSQQEYRLAGSLSGEDQIINAYLNGIDMHTKTGAILYGKETGNVTKEERSFGKTINFAILYGTSAWGMANNLKMPESKAKEIMDIFFSGYPKLSAFIGQAKEMILERGFSVTALGRRRYNKESPLFGTPYQKKLFSSRVTREGFNHIIQGTAADITKLAMINIYENNPFGKDLKVLMQIHDEVICEAREEVAQEAYDYVQREMIAAEQPFLGRIPAVADGYISNTWEKA